MAGKSIILVVLIMTLSAAAALAADPPASEKQRPICRGGARQLGTHMRTQQRCRTLEQWQREDEAKGGPLPPSLQITEGQNDGRQGAAPR